MDGSFCTFEGGDDPTQISSNCAVCDAHLLIPLPQKHYSGCTIVIHSDIHAEIKYIKRKARKDKEFKEKDSIRNTNSPFLCWCHLFSELSYKYLVVICSYKLDPFIGCLSCSWQHSRTVPQGYHPQKSLKYHQSDIIFVGLKQILEFMSNWDVSAYIIHWLRFIKQVQETVLRCCEKSIHLHSRTPKVFVRLCHIAYENANHVIKHYRF